MSKKKSTDKIFNLEPEKYFSVANQFQMLTYIFQTCVHNFKDPLHQFQILRNDCKQLLAVMTIVRSKCNEEN